MCSENDITTIAFDGTTLAADRKAAGDGVMNVRKIFKLKRGGYLAGAGYMDQLVEVARWIDAGMKDTENPFTHKHGAENETDYLYIDKNGAPYWLTSPWLRPVRIAEKYVALGSGGDAAWGAMRAGATPRRAVSIAGERDVYTGSGIDVVKVKG